MSTRKLDDPYVKIKALEQRLSDLAAKLGRVGQVGNDWATYTPTWSGTIGNGTVTGRYVQVGALVAFTVRITWGSTTTHGASLQSVSLPVSAHSIDGAVSVQCRDSSASAEYGGTGRLNGANVEAWAIGDAGRVSDTVPFTWANGDLAWITGTYEAA